MKKIFYLVFILLIVISCNRKEEKSDNYILKYWSCGSFKKSEELSKDTIYDKKYIYLEEQLTIKKNIVDSIIKERLFKKEVKAEDFIITVDTLFYRMFNNKKIELSKISFAIVERGYFVSTIYSQEFGLILKYYHGHGKCMLQKIEKINKDGIEEEIILKTFSILLMEDTTVFPKLPPPPPPPNS